MSQHQAEGIENRTGVAVAPERAAEMVAATREFPPSSEGNGHLIAGVRVRYAREDGSDQPRRAMENRPLLMDKLGERLAFERAGTRLYEALVSKHEAYGSFEGGPSRDDLTHVLEEEMQHFHMLRAAIEELGGDPTELTPSANVQLVASHGIGQVLTDPRTTLVQSLEAIAVAELADNECWETLVGLTRLAGLEELAQRCEQALATEQEHLEKVRSWLAAGQGRPETEGEGAVEVETGAATRPRRSASRGRARAR
jgi:rubrerythrin